MPEVALQMDIWIWLALAITCLTIEIFTVSAFFLAASIASFAVAISLAFVPELSLNWQLVIFAVAGLASTFLIKFAYSRLLKGSDKPELNNPIERFRNKTFKLNKPITNGRGKVKIGDGWWLVEGPELPAGTEVKVIDIKSAILVIEKVDQG